MFGCNLSATVNILTEIRNLETETSKWKEKKFNTAGLLMQSYQIFNLIFELCWISLLLPFPEQYIVLVGYYLKS